MYNKISIKLNILTIEQNTSGSRSDYGLVSTPVKSGRILSAKGNVVPMHVLTACAPLIKPALDGG